MNSKTGHRVRIEVGGFLGQNNWKRARELAAAIRIAIGAAWWKIWRSEGGCSDGACYFPSRGFFRNPQQHLYNHEFCMQKEPARSGHDAEYNLYQCSFQR